MMIKKNKKIKIIFFLILIIIIIISLLILAGYEKYKDNKKINGMQIEKILNENNINTVITSGAIFKINLENKTIEAYQKIGEKRLMAIIKIYESWPKLIIDYKKNNFNYILYGEGENTSKIIISGDSVISFENIKKIKIKTYFNPIYKKLNKQNNGLLLLDDYGGIIIAPHQLDSEEVLSEIKNDLWKIESVEPLSTFFAICPARKFDWPSSFQLVLHYSSHVERYPTNEQIIEYSKYAKILELHSWVWKNRYSENANKDWENEWNKEPLWADRSYIHENYKWIPDDDLEFRRVINIAHQNGMKVVPYLPLLKGDVDRHMAEIKRLKNEYQIDGLYVDGLYIKDIKKAYEFAKYLRNLFGNDGWLTLHDTHPGGYFIPFIQSYMNLIITSEHQSFDRWLSTSYNISNTTSSIWPEIPLKTNDARNFLKELVNKSLLYNNRLIFMTGLDGQWRNWRLYFTQKEFEFIKEYYLKEIKELKRLGFNKFVSQKK